MNRKFAGLVAGLLLVATGLAAQMKPSTWTAPSAAQVDAIYPDIESLYFDLHRNPELSEHEVQTAAKLASRMKALGYDVTDRRRRHRHRRHPSQRRLAPRSCLRTEHRRSSRSKKKPACPTPVHSSLQRMTPAAFSSASCTPAVMTSTWPPVGSGPPPSWPAPNRQHWHGTLIHR